MDRLRLWNEEGLQRKFDAIGAELAFSPLPSRAARGTTYTLDVQPVRGTHRERFLLSVTAQTSLDVEVLHARETERHLLLLVKAPTSRGLEKHRYLCGHDERHWFVASVPDARRRATTVGQAMDALQPEEIHAGLRHGGVRHKVRHARRNPAFVRQGEWFFLAAPDASFDPVLVHRDEPLRRGRSKPHWVQDLVRWGGETVYVCRQRPQGLRKRDYESLLVRQPDARFWGWLPMQANPKVFARGRVWHPDHATIVLAGWHRVLPNEESKASWGERVTFLD
jgi:hypothetical protein